MGGVTGWVAMSQELLGPCVIRLRAVLASLGLLPPLSHPHLHRGLLCRADGAVSKSSEPSQRSQDT